MSGAAARTHFLSKVSEPGHLSGRVAVAAPPCHRHDAREAVATLRGRCKGVGCAAAAPCGMPRMVADVVAVRIRVRWCVVVIAVVVPRWARGGGWARAPPASAGVVVDHPPVRMGGRRGGFGMVRRRRFRRRRRRCGARRGGDGNRRRIASSHRWRCFRAVDGCCFFLFRPYGRETLHRRSGSDNHWGQSRVRGWGGRRRPEHQAG